MAVRADRFIADFCHRLTYRMSANYHSCRRHNESLPVLSLIAFTVVALPRTNFGEADLHR